MQKNKNILRTARIATASVLFCGITLMLCDFTGGLHAYLSWMAKIQFFPALLRIGAVAGGGGLAVVLLTLLLTLVFGRVYCSVVCPLGVMQDVASWWASRKWQRKISKQLGKMHFRYQKERIWVRYGVLVVFAVLCFIPATAALAHVIAPYSAYGRIVQAVFAPLYAWCNNGLAMIADYYGSYAVYPTEVWLKSGLTLGIALALFVGITLWAFFKGRAWCNTVCPIGTLLGTVSRYSLFRPVIQEDKCINCGACARQCKAQCIDAQHHCIDMSRCVDCFDCLHSCTKDAIRYEYVGWKINKAKQGDDTKRNNTMSQQEDVAQQRGATDAGRRNFLGIAGGLLAATVVAQAQGKTDGGLAVIEQKKLPKRTLPIKPAGSQSLRHFATYCTTCQLCVSACPQGVLRPSSDLKTLMQPEMQYDKGYCLTGCTRCADVCPTGAISLRDMLGERGKDLDVKEIKTAVQIGHAVWIADNCVVNSDNVSCGNCARHCPTGAIVMVEKDGKHIPAIDTEQCIGCGHCEYVCPARPFSAIYVEGHETQRVIL